MKKLTPEEKRRRRAEWQRQYYWKHHDEFLAKLRQRWHAGDGIKHQARKRQRRVEKAKRPKPDICDVCGDNTTDIVFDHCHQRGIFRGWLCNPCNRALGCVRDDPDRLRKLIAYLERTKDWVDPQFSLPGL